MAYATSNFRSFDGSRVIPFARRSRRGMGDIQLPDGSFMASPSDFGPSVSTTNFINALTSNTGPLPLGSGVPAGSSSLSSAFGGNTLLYVAGALLLAYFLISRKG